MTLRPADFDGGSFGLARVDPQRRSADPEKHENDEYFPHGRRLYRQLA